MINKALTKFGISVALMLMVAELTYVNALSLLYIVGKSGLIHEIMSINGSLAFSIVTIIVMQTSERKWPKYVFPVFDAALVFLGFNLEYYDSIVNGTDNDVRFFMTIVLALFTGFITFCLGIINYEKYLKSDSKESESKILEYVRKLDVSEGNFYKLKSEFDKYKTEIANKNSEFESLKSKLDEKQSKINSLESDIEKMQSDLVSYRKSYLLSERSRILKKKSDNRTQEDSRVLAESELLLANN